MFSTFLALSALAAPQAAPRVEVLRSTLPGSVTSEVPGYPGIEITKFRDFSISPSGRFVVLAQSTGSTPAHFVIGDDGTVLGNGEVAPWTSADTMILSYSAAGVAVNDAGQIFVNTLVNESTGGQRVWIARKTGGAWLGMYDSKSAIPGAPGVFFNAFDELNGLANGQVAFYTDARGLPLDRNRFLLNPPAILEREGVTGPIDSLSGALLDVWDNWSADASFQVTPDGAHRLVRGTVASAPSLSNEFYTYDGDLIIAEQTVLAGSGFVDPVLEVYHMHLGHEGTWMATGVNDPPGSASPREFWFVRDGAVVAQTGDPIVPGDARIWHDGTGVARGAYFAVSNGTQHYLAGYGDHTGTGDRKQVIVLEGDQVVLEAGDPIDLDGNGLFDDNLIVEAFGVEQWNTVDRTGRLWLIAILRDTANNKTVEALLRISPHPVTLAVPTLVGGQAATIEVQDAVPGKTAVLLYSLAGGGPASFPTPFGTLAFAVGAPFSVSAPVAVPGSGTASFPVFIPAALSGATVWAQAGVYDASSGQLSNGFRGLVM
ncbi:MAG: hypothetical protein CMJ94_03885 [Planctomycetes bacterium]|nr:hypothetical protein [Planctomycetota bacterium]